ncbi:hypothetical protein BX666DRAFT_2003447 [Dichotomocladium elegans]|nr:hypothetical protein BX666DRAFT_2003447 [Dichotomocladium elegans]
MKSSLKDSKTPFYNSIRKKWSSSRRKTSKQAPPFLRKNLSKSQLSSMSSLTDYADHTFNLKLKEEEIHAILSNNNWDLKQAMLELDKYEEAYHGLLHGPPDHNQKLQGAENDGGTSCYIDALLFAMYQSLTAFDPLLTYDTSADQPQKAILQAALRLFVNTLRKGGLVNLYIVRRLREALQAAGWNGQNDRGAWMQEDASEFLLFLTETFDLPYLPFQMRLFHGANKDNDDDRVMTDRVLSLSLPSRIATSVGKQADIRLENILLDYFYSSIVTGVKRQVDLHESESSSTAPQSPKSVASQSSMTKAKVTERYQEVAVNAWQVLELLPFYSGINEQGVQIESQDRGSFPDSRMVLPIILKRYYCTTRGNYLKDQRRVIVPANIPFSRFLNQNAEDPICEVCGCKIEAVMRLRSAVCHKGSAPYTGHYIAYSRTFVQNEDFWLKHDDLAITQRVKALQQDDKEAIYEDLSRDGYLFFYELYRECHHATESQIPQWLPPPLPPLTAAEEKQVLKRRELGIEDSDPVQVRTARRPSIDKDRTHTEDGQLELPSPPPELPYHPEPTTSTEAAPSSTRSRNSFLKKKQNTPCLIM